VATTSPDPPPSTFCSIGRLPPTGCCDATRYVDVGPTANDTPALSARMSGTVMPFQRRTSNAFERSEYATTLRPSRRRPRTTNRYVPAGVADGRSPRSRTSDANASKCAVQRHF
jgi:hypothetical protein